MTRSIRADESVKVVSAEANTTTSSVTSTNAIEVTTNAFSIQTNNPVSISINQPAAGTTNQPLTDDLSSMTSLTLVIEERPEAGLFSGQSGNGSFGFANIEAGFGQAYDNDSIVLRGRNGTAWEETRYLFLKKVVKF